MLKKSKKGIDSNIEREYHNKSWLQNQATKHKKDFQKDLKK